MNDINETMHLIGKDINEIFKSYLFEFNNEETRKDIAENVSDYLESYKQTKEIKDYTVVCDTSNNTSEDVEKGILNLDIAISVQSKKKKTRYHCTIGPKIIPEDEWILL